MDRMACVSLPAFPLQLLVRRHPDWKSIPAAVVDKDKPQGVIQWVNKHAMRLSILPGMRYAKGLSLCTNLRAGVISSKEISDAVGDITDMFRFYTPDIEPSHQEPGIYWLNASGLSLLYPSLGKWAGLISTDLTKRGYYCAIAVGFSRYGTYATARSRKGITIFDTPDSERSTARATPIVRLGFEPCLRDALDQLGITTLGGFIDLPEDGIRKRLGDAAHTLYRLARNELFAPIEAIAAKTPLAETVFLDHPESSIERLMAMIVERLQLLVISADEKGCVLRELILSLHLDNGNEHNERLRPASPTMDTKELARLIELRLHNISLSSGVVNLRLEVKILPANPKQMELFIEKPRRDTRAIDRAFAQLRAEFGEQTVLRARIREGHLPEARFEWEPMDTLATPTPRRVNIRNLIRRIFSRNRGVTIDIPTIHPSHAQLHMRRQHPNDDVIGPFVVTGGWWQRPLHREYYFVRNTHGQWLWLYYDAKRKQTFLQGAVE